MLKLSRWPVEARWVLPAAALLYAINLWLLADPLDDAFITFRYLDNWLAGHGLVFNPGGERVEGYSNLLWLLLIAPFRVLGGAPERIALVLSLLSLVVLSVSLYVIAYRMTGSARAGAFAALLPAAYPAISYHAAGGLETVFFAALLAAACARVAVAGRPDAWTALILGCAVLARPDAMLAAGCLYAAYLLPRPDKRTLRSLALFAIFPVAVTLWRLAYYGDPVPNTAYAKAVGGGPWLWMKGLAYLKEYATYGAGLMLWVLAMAAVAGRRRLADQRLLWAMLATCAGFVAYTVDVGGDYVSLWRFPVHTQGLLFALVACGVWVIGERASRVPVVLASALIALQLVGTYASHDYREARLVAGVHADFHQTARWLKENFPPSAVVALNPVGIPAYYSGLQVIDMLGLNDRHIARGKIDRTAQPGHFRYDGTYVCQLSPDVLLTAGSRPIAARSAQEAEISAATNAFAGDKEFLRSCGDRYVPWVSQEPDGRYRVAFVRGQRQSVTSEVAGNAEELFRQGLERMARADTAGARSSFEASLALNPDQINTRYNIGLTYLDEGRLDQAQQVFTHLMQLYPGYPDAKYGQALVFERLGDRQRAIGLWREYIAMPNAPAAWKRRAAEKIRILGGDPN